MKKNQGLNIYVWRKCNRTKKTTTVNVTEYIVLINILSMQWVWKKIWNIINTCCCCI